MVDVFHYFRILTLVSAIIFVTSGNSLKLNCDFDYIENCVTNCYKCTVLKLVITKPNQTVTEINGNHSHGDSNNVITLRIIDQIVRFFPSGLNSHFPNLSVLKIWSSRLMELSQKDVRRFTYLTDLSVSGNDLETLNSNIFEFNHRLQHIDFTRNRLKHIGPNILKPLTQLVYADFYQNDCLSTGAKFSFEELTSNFREKCKPTADMMLEEIDSLHLKVDYLIDETESLKREIERQDKKEVKVCQEDEKEVHARLDTFFPGEIDWDESDRV